MKRFLLALFFAPLLLTSHVIAADSEETPAEAAAREARVKARLAEHAQKNRADAKTEYISEQDLTDSDESDEELDQNTDDAVVTIIPEFRVNSQRISDLDIEIKKLNKQIKRYSKQIKRTDLDKTLNSGEQPKILNIFGGNTADQREAIAYERVSLMEAERDILEAMKYVQTHEKDKELTKQLNAIRSMRTNLEKDLR